MTYHPTNEQLAQLQDQTDEYMKNRKRFPASKIDELRELGAKRCGKCHRVQRLEDFTSNKTNRDGLRGQCRQCDRAKSADHRRSNPEYYSEYYEQNRETKIEYAREYHRENFGDRALYDGYRRAVSEGNTAERFSYEDLLQHWENIGVDPLTCYYSGAPLVPGENHSLDHLVPISSGGGHVLRNIVPADLSTNSSKKNAPVHEFCNLTGDINSEVWN